MEYSVTVALVLPFIYVNATSAVGETEDIIFKCRLLATTPILFQCYDIAQIK